MGMANPHGSWVWISVGMGMGQTLAYPYPYPYPPYGYVGISWVSRGCKSFYYGHLWVSEDCQISIHYSVQSPLLQLELEL
jgi:hypothetical protein